jgi:hypothetical protein
MRTKPKIKIYKIRTNKCKHKIKWDQNGTKDKNEWEDKKPKSNIKIKWG